MCIFTVLDNAKMFSNAIISSTCILLRWCVTIPIDLHFPQNLVFLYWLWFLFAGCLTFVFPDVKTIPLRFSWQSLGLYLLNRLRLQYWLIWRMVRLLIEIKRKGEKYDGRNMMRLFLWKSCKIKQNRLKTVFLWYVYTMEHYAAERKKELLPFTTAWMERETIMLSEVSQVVKDKYHMISPISGT